MKVFFFNEINKYDSVGIESLSSYIRARGFQSRVCLVPDLVYNTTITMEWMRFFKPWTMIPDREYLRYILAQKPDVLCFSAVTDYFARSAHLAAIAKELNPGITTVVGGPHCTLCTESAVKLPQFDYVCKGEGELPLTALLESLRDGRRSPDIPGIYYRRNGSVRGAGIGAIVQNLDEIPFLDKDDVISDYPYFERLYFMNTLRGCMYNCTYCGSPGAREEYRANGINILRRRSVGSVIRELAHAKKKYRKMRFVGFCDDTFSWPRDWVMEFAREYKKHVGLPFFMCTNPVLFKEEEMVRALKEAGLLYVEIGVQAIDEEYRMKQTKRPDTDADIFASARLMQKYDIYIQVNHIFGLDRRDLSDEAFLRRTVEYYMRLGPNRTHCFELEYLPGSEEMQRALGCGYISSDDHARVMNGDTSCAYNFGGSMKNRKLFTPYVVFLDMIPFLPKALRRLIFNNKFLFGLIRKVPLGYIILARMLNTAIFDRRDIEGRPHYGKYIDGCRYLARVKKALRRLRRNK